EEVATTARAVLMTGPGVERRRAADERIEAPWLVMIGQGSRSAILRQCMAWQERATGFPGRPVKQVGGRPPALSAGVGALAACVAVNRAALEAEVQRRRQTALRPPSTNGQIPVSIQTTAGSARSSVSQRIVPDRDCPACARWQPLCDGPPVASRRLLSAWAPGFFRVQVGATKWAVSRVSRGVRSLVLPPHAEGGNWELVLATSMFVQYLGMDELYVLFRVPSAAVDLVSVYRLEPRLERACPGKMLSFRFLRACLVDVGDLPWGALRDSDAEAPDADEMG
ncbi:unnamed protein product, partial [Prorocentrum cordatum]